MPVRTSQAEWKGSLREGKGTMRVGAGVFEGAYSFSSRFEEGSGTNPEELIAAAHAGCFSMALSAILGEAGYRPEAIRTSARVHIEKAESGFAITKIELSCDGHVPGIDEQSFQQLADQAKKGCPVSRALAAVPEITLQARLA